jgi:putative nucleotidyltransferase with HDIG domain
MGTALAKNVLVNASLPSLVRIGGLILSAIALIVLIGFTLSALITRPLTSLMHASEAVTDGDLSVKVTRQTNDEIGVLAESFNKMVLSLNQSHQRMVETYDKTLEGWAKALELKDKETSGHTLRVTELTVALARRLNLPEDQIEHIRRGAMLHDIGKMGIPDQILLKPGPLDEKEWKQMRDHPAYAHEMLKDIPFLEPALEIPYCHHERWDGKGYPRQLKGDQIPLPARLFAIVDAWDALTSNRPYHQGLDDEKALQEIQAGAGSQFDPNLVAVFCEFVQTRQ